MNTYTFTTSIGIHNYLVRCDIDGEGGELPPLRIGGDTDIGISPGKLSNLLRQHIVFNALDIELGAKARQTWPCIVWNYDFRLDHLRQFKCVVDGKRVPFMIDARYGTSFVPDVFEWQEPPHPFRSKRRTWLVQAVENRYCWYYPNVTAPRIFVSKKHSDYADYLFLAVGNILRQERKVRFIPLKSGGQRSKALNAIEAPRKPMAHFLIYP